MDLNEENKATQTAEDTPPTGSEDMWGEALAEQALGEQDGDTEIKQAASDLAKAESGNAVKAEMFQDISTGAPGEGAPDVNFILDIPIQFTVELGRIKMPIRSLLSLAQGSVVELDGLAGDPLSIFANGCLIAQGEVVVVNEKFGIRVTEVIASADRIRKLGN